MADLALVDVIAAALVNNNVHSPYHGTHDLARRVAAAVVAHQQQAVDAAVDLAGRADEIAWHLEKAAAALRDGALNVQLSGTIAGWHRQLPPCETAS